MTQNAPERAYEEADVVFRGRVLAYHEPDPPELVRDLPLPDFVIQSFVRSAELEVEEAWKGVEIRTITLHASDSNCGWGMPRLRAGTEVLVFAREHREDDAFSGLWVDTCYSVIHVDHPWAQDARDRLGPGMRPLSQGGWYWLERLGPFGLLLLALPLGWYRWSRRR